MVIVGNRIYSVIKIFHQLQFFFTRSLFYYRLLENLHRSDILVTFILVCQLLMKKVGRYPALICTIHELTIIQNMLINMTSVY